MDGQTDGRLYDPNTKWNKYDANGGGRGGGGWGGKKMPMCIYVGMAPSVCLCAYLYVCMFSVPEVPKEVIAITNIWM